MIRRLWQLTRGSRVEIDENKFTLGCQSALTQLTAGATDTAALQLSGVALGAHSVAALERPLFVCTRKSFHNCAFVLKVVKVEQNARWAQQPILGVNSRQFRGGLWSEKAIRFWYMSFRMVTLRVASRFIVVFMLCRLCAMSDAEPAHKKARPDTNTACYDTYEEQSAIESLKRFMLVALSFAAALEACTENMRARTTRAKLLLLSSLVKRVVAIRAGRFACHSIAVHTHSFPTS
jgi:hypothetical protein